MSDQAPAAAPSGEPQQNSIPAPQAAPVGNILAGDQSPAPQTTWLDALPQDLKGDPNLSKFKDVNGLAKSYVEQSKLLGKPKIEAPSENWKPEQWNELFDKLGRPKTPADYKFDTSVVPDGRRDEQMEKFFAEKMHTSGLTQKQAEALHKEFVGYQLAKDQAMQKAIAESNEQSYNQLKQEWGDKFPAKIVSAFWAAKELGGQELSSLLNQSGLGNHPTLVKMFSKIGDMMAEDTIRGRSTGSAFTQSPASALAEITNMKMDSEFMAAFNNRAHAAHKEAVAKWNKLHDVAYSAQSPL